MSDSSKASPVIRILRHGEPVGGRRYRGCTDDPLSDLGWDQMRDAVATDGGWQRVVTSPLCRCHDFASATADRRGAGLVVDERFSEMGYGDWEGLTPDAIDRRWPGARKAYRADPMSNLPPNAESLNGFLERVEAGWRDLVDAAAGGQLLLVTHAGVIRALFTLLLDLPPAAMFRVAIPYAGGCRVSYPGPGPDAPARVELL